MIFKDLTGDSEQQWASFIIIGELGIMPTFLFAPGDVTLQSKRTANKDI
jgi:hypothetical protein